MNEIKKHPHDVDVDVGIHTTKWGSLLNIIRQIGYPVLLLRLNADMQPEGTGYLAETEQQYRQVIQSWMDYNENLHIRIVPGQTVKAQA